LPLVSCLLSLASFYRNLPHPCTAHLFPFSFIFLLSS